MDDYHEFCDAHEVDIEKWRQNWLPNYFSITKGQLITLTPIPSTIIIGDGLGPSTLGGNGNDLIISAWVLLTFNPIIEFFEDFHTNY